MPLTPGTKFGSYQVLGLLGAGAMGEVYRALDTRLKREVAIKVLPEAFTRDLERISRFQREAEVLASLNHPNIAAIHHLEEAEGARFLVLELVEGETLADRIARGPVPVEESLGIARQIAEAMEAAHAKGIVHRDLKPANVKITPEGKVKVLDFGLAKIYEPETTAPNFSQSPTLMGGTMAGALIGTAAYMSPEQARGQTADDQSDIWAFGCILYELLTGRSSFQGDTMADVFGSIVKSEPGWKALPDSTPPSIVLLLRRCLQKDRKRRLRHIGDAALEIDEALTNPAMALAIPAVAPIRQLFPAYVWIGALVVLAIGVIAFVSSRSRTPPDTQTIRFTVPPPQRFFRRGETAQFALSPDGRHLVFVAEDTTRKLWIRPLDSAEARPLPGTDNAIFPFWSPDSRYVGFFSGQTLNKVTIADGHSQVICDVSGFPEATWNQYNVIVFSDEGNLFRVSGDGGAPEPLVKTNQPSQQRLVSAPRFLPDGDHLLYGIKSGQRESDGLWVMSLKSGDTKRILPFAAPGMYSPTGHILYLQDGKLIARPFDLGKLAITGEPIALDDATRNDISDFDLSSNGILAWSAKPVGAAELIWRDRAGNKQKTTLGAGLYRQIRLSPDATRAAVSVTNNGIWILEMSSGVFSRFTSGPGNENDMVWSPEGRELAFASRGNLYRRPLGAPVPVAVLESSDNKWLHDWSPDGLLVFARSKGIYTVPVSAPAQPSTVVENEFDKDEFKVSPDGHWIAYNSDESGRTEVYVASFPRFDRRRQVSNSGGSIPRWRADMREIYYLRLDGTLMAVDVRSEDALETGPPHALFQAQVPVSKVLDQYDVTADGKRFLVIENEENAVSPPITIVVHWAQKMGS